MVAFLDDYGFPDSLQPLAFSLVFCFWLLVFAFELATYLTLGPPWVTMDKTYLLDQIAQAAPGEQFGGCCLLSTPNGYFARCGVGLTGNIYYCDLHHAGSRVHTLIPWWSPIHRALVRRKAEIQKAESRKP